MAIKINGQNANVIRYTGKDSATNQNIANADVKLVRVNGQYRWAKTMTLMLTLPVGTSIVISRVSSYDPAVSKGTIYSGTASSSAILTSITVYYGDELTITTSALAGYNVSSIVYTGLTRTSYTTMRVDGDAMGLASIIVSVSRIKWSLNVVVPVEENLVFWVSYNNKKTQFVDFFEVSMTGDCKPTELSHGPYYTRSSNPSEKIYLPFGQTTTISGLDYSETITLHTNAHPMTYYKQTGTGSAEDILPVIPTVSQYSRPSFVATLIGYHLGNSKNVAKQLAFRNYKTYSYQSDANATITLTQKIATGLNAENSVAGTFVVPETASPYTDTMFRLYIQGAGNNVYHKATYYAHDVLFSNGGAVLQNISNIAIISITANAASSSDNEHFGGTYTVNTNIVPINYSFAITIYYRYYVDWVKS